MLIQKAIKGRTAAAIAASVESSLFQARIGRDDRLPTVRDLAASLKVSPATVAAAYRILRSRGLIAGEGRRGTRVAVGSVTPGTPQAATDVAASIDLASGNPDPALLPPLEPALRSIDTSPHLYGAPAQLRALATFAASEFATDGIDARCVAVAGGALDAIERTLREHLRTGDSVAVEDPGYPGILDGLRAAGLNPVPCPIDDDGPLPDAIEHALRRGCRAIVVTPRAQDPTGAAISQARAADLRRVLRPFASVLLIENDYAAPIAGAPCITLVDESRPHWVVIRSTSAFLGPDLRLAVMTGDELTIARILNRQAAGARWVSGILQQLALAMWSDPSSARRLARAADIYAQRREALLTALRARHIDARGRSGLSVWIPVREEHRVTHGLAERGWAVAPGERFRIASPPAIRVTTATLTPPDAERLADDLAAVR